MPTHSVVACPHCGKAVEWTPAACWRPFCSERCKLIDFGAWASGAYRIATTESPEPDDLATAPDTSPRDRP